MDDAPQSETNPDRHNAVRVYRQVMDAIDTAVPLLTAVALLMVCAAAVITLQGQSRINRIVNCFGSYTQAYNTASAERVEATEHLEDAASENDAASVAWVQSVIDLLNRQDPEGKNLRETTTGLLATLLNVQDARGNLQDTRDDNPFPEPCSVTR